MSFKSLASAILLAVIITIIMPVQGSQDDESYQVLPIGNYNVYLDFAGKDITIKPVSASSSLDTITRSIMVQGSDDTDFAVV